VPLETHDRFVDPRQNLFGRKAVEDVVADIGDERACRDARRGIELCPES
jgi:hypothetical protein